MRRTRTEPAALVVDFGRRPPRHLSWRARRDLSAVPCSTRRVGRPTPSRPSSRRPRAGPLAHQHSSPDGHIRGVLGRHRGPRAGLYHARIAADGSLVRRRLPSARWGSTPRARAETGACNSCGRHTRHGPQRSTMGWDAASDAVHGAHEIVAFGVPTGSPATAPPRHRPGRATYSGPSSAAAAAFAPPSAESSYVSFPGQPARSGQSARASSSPRRTAPPTARCPAPITSTPGERRGASASTFVYLRAPSRASGTSWRPPFAGRFGAHQEHRAGGPGALGRR